SGCRANRARSRRLLARPVPPRGSSRFDFWASWFAWLGGEGTPAPSRRRACPLRLYSREVWFSIEEFRRRLSSSSRRRRSMPSGRVPTPGERRAIGMSWVRIFGIPAQTEDLPPVGRGGRLHGSAEDLGQVALRGEADRQRDLGDRPVGVAQQLAG